MSCRAPVPNRRQGIACRGGWDLVAEGARVVVAGRSEEALDLALTQTSVHDHPTVRACKVEVATAANCMGLVEQAVELLGGLDVVMHAIGINNRVPISRTTDDVWADILTTNLTGACWLARAKRLSEGRVVYIPAMCNAMLSVSTITGFTYGALLGGAVLTESIFGWPGLGRYAVSSIPRLAFGAVMGVVIVMTITTVVVNLLVDLLSTKLNPPVAY